MNTQHNSPDNKYTLTLTSTTTKPGCWDYTTGIVTDENGKTIATINRNFSAFPHLFINHPNGHDYLICGEDYQGQTVIELDTGKRKDNLPPEAEQGHAFCWANYKFDHNTKILIVSGCHWACPYEYRFYDFSDPMNGWPELKSEDYISADNKEPEINGNTITTYETIEDEQDEQEITTIKTYTRNNNTLILQNEWISDKEQQRRKESQKANERYEAEMEQFKKTDPLYLKYIELLKTVPNATTYIGIGITHDGWCPHFTEKECRWCHRLHDDTSILTIDLEWAIKTGPIKLVIYKNGKKHDDKYYNHSTEDMEKAFKDTLELIKT